jgi:hypothetical protein
MATKSETRNEQTERIDNKSLTESAFSRIEVLAPRTCGRAVLLLTQLSSSIASHQRIRRTTPSEQPQEEAHQPFYLLTRSAEKLGMTEERSMVSDNNLCQAAANVEHPRYAVH